MAEEAKRPNYILIWIGLVVLVTISIMAGSFLPKTAAVALIFFIAAVKSVMVLLNYMHLKFEGPLIYALVFIPLLIVIVLLFALFPDFVFRS